MIAQAILRAYNDRGSTISEVAFPPADMANVQAYIDAFAARLMAQRRAFVRITVDLALTPEESWRGLFIGLLEPSPEVAS